MIKKWELSFITNKEIEFEKNIFSSSSNKKGTDRMPVPYNLYISNFSYVELLACTATTTAATAAAATATVVETAAAAPAAPADAADAPAAPALPLAPPAAALCEKEGELNDSTKVKVAKILRIRIS